MKGKYDFLVSEATYDLGRQLRYAMRHKITEQGVLDGQVVDKMTLASEIMKKETHVTAFYTLDGWRLGKKIKAYIIDGKLFVRTDDNKVLYDNLGDLPEVKKAGFKPSSAKASNMKPTNESPLSKLRKRHLENDKPAADNKISDTLTYTEPSHISATDVLKDRGNLRARYIPLSSQGVTSEDPFADISEADIVVYSGIYKVSQTKNEEESKILADKIREWIAQGRSLPATKTTSDEPTAPDAKPEPEAIPDTQEDKPEALLPTADPVETELEQNAASTSLKTEAKTKSVPKTKSYSAYLPNTTLLSQISEFQEKIDELIPMSSSTPQPDNDLLHKITKLQNKLDDMESMPPPEPDPGQAERIAELESHIRDLESQTTSNDTLLAQIDMLQGKLDDMESMPPPEPDPGQA
ncbi:MAG: hypothetical protein F4Z11_01765, partial [Cenarchaeum sp. SB0666_bin_15]|nr:hypothetical protein [Cenarchaeum sp. SB0666_bin_15]